MLGNESLPQHSSEYRVASYAFGVAGEDMKISFQLGQVLIKSCHLQRVFRPQGPPFTLPVIPMEMGTQ
jgi:hypothetical protein